MQKKNKAFKFRLYPNESQKELLAKTFGCARFIYNKMLEDKISYYNETKKMLKCYPSQYKDEYEWLKEVDSSALVGAYNSLNIAYKNFFERQEVGFPKFKTKRRSKKSYTTYLINNNIRLEGNRIKLPKLKWVRVVLHREIPEGYILKSVTVSQSSSGRYYVSMLYEYYVDIKPVEVNSSVGIDFSMKEGIVTSDGLYASYPHYFKKYEVKLAKEQKKLSRKIVGSNNWNKQRIKVAKIHEHIRNSRVFFLHNLSRQIVKTYDAVMIEDLNMKEMSKSLKLGKGVHDNGFGMFVSMLKYKLEDEGKKLIKVNKWYPSSKTCSCCGRIKDITLSERVYECECGNVMDRDLNAAINIKKEGIRILTNTLNINPETQGASLCASTH